jgi:hypothetical protein
VLRRAVLGLAVLAACDHDVDDGFFSPTGMPAAPTTAASGNQDDGSDGRAETGESSTADASTATAADDGPADPTQTDPSAGETGTDPTFGDPEGSSDGGFESTGVDPTGVDPTGVDPTGDAGACCEVQAGPGCGDAGVEACVCGLDDFCCSIQWDDVCVGEANDCGAGCVGGGGGGAGDCCVAQDLPGCSDAGVEACVCALDDFCCSVTWDETCVLEAADCGAIC